MKVGFVVGIAVGLIIGLIIGATTTTYATTKLPAGFTIQHADGYTYVCSTTPVMCTGNK